MLNQGDKDDITAASYSSTHPLTVEERLTKRFVQDNIEARKRNQVITLLIRIGLVVGFFGLWEVLSGPVLDPFFFSSPADIISQLAKWVESGELSRHLQYTFTAMFLGYLLGVTLGLINAVIFGLVYFLYRVVEPVILVIYSVPAVAIGPLLIIWFGLGMTPKVLLAAFFVFYVVFMNTITGIRNVNVQLIDVALVMGAKRRQIVTKIILPNAYPYILTALRITLPSALIGAIVGEFISSNRGIAYLIMASSMRFNTAGTFGALIILAIVVMVMNAVLTKVESWLMRWKPDMDIVQ